MKLPQLGDSYSGESMRELVRQLELTITRLQNQVASSSVTTTDLSDATPRPLGSAAPGTATLASRSDHVHPLPTAADVGADVSGTAAAAVAAHEAESNPHPQYQNSLTLIAAGESHTVVENTALLLIDEGLDVEGELIIEGSVYSVA